ncbi:uncharacterized protein WCC33_009743 [Rhinophrynus dorsalis]
MIHHLSYPKGSSVNDDIDKEESRVHYASFDRALALVRAAGTGCWLAKSDIQSAFRLLPVHPDCYHLLGCCLRGYFFFDKCLPMGCAISCYYFEVFSSFLEWVVRSEAGLHSMLHYLDDFLFVGPADKEDCVVLLDTFRRMAQFFGIPVAEEKTEGPVKRLAFLGIEIDSEKMIFRLPDEKLCVLKLLVDRAKAAKKLSLKQMQQLLGHLVFACKVMPMGRAFCRRLSLAMRGIRASHHFIRITASLREDLGVWQKFLVDYNGHTCWQESEVNSQELAMFTDASGSVGFGAFFRGAWCAQSWPDCVRQSPLVRNLAFLELFPIVVAVEIWGEKLRNKKVLFWSDNMAVVHVINRSTSKSYPVLALLRHLVLLCLRHNISFRARHVPGMDNAIADSLSRLQLDRFRLLVPEAETEGYSCPEYLWTLVSQLC